MTEHKLSEAIKIKQNLDSQREIRNNIAEKRSLCTGNTSEVRKRKFELHIKDGMNILKIYISSDAAYEALNIDFKNSCNIVKSFESELEQLN